MKTPSERIEHFNSFEGWSEIAIEAIEEQSGRISVLLESPEEVKQAIEDHNNKFLGEDLMQIRFSRDLTVRKGSEVNVPLMDKWHTPLNKALKDSGLREKYDLYREAYDLDAKNTHAKFYVKYVNGEAKEPYAWVMGHGLKMPIHTEEQYDKAAEHYDIDSERTTPPKIYEIMSIIEALGYKEDVKETDDSKVLTHRMKIDTTLGK